MRSQHQGHGASPWIYPCYRALHVQGIRGKRAAMVVNDSIVEWLVIDTLCEFQNTKVEKVVEDVFNMTSAESILTSHTT